MSASGSASVRSEAARLVDWALSSGAPLDGALAAAQASLEPRDRRLLQQLVYGTLRWLLRLDDVLARAANRSLERIDAELRSPLRVAAFQILFLDRVPAYAAVSEAVDEARRRAPRGVKFVNAVLRRLSRAPRLEDWPVERAEPLERLAIETSHPEFLVRRWSERFGLAAAESVLAANNRQRPMHLLAMPASGGREAVAGRLAEEGVETRSLAFAPAGLEVVGGDALATGSFANGDFYVQDQASQVAARVPPPRPGEQVLDAAAAPGGKSFSLLASEPGVRPFAGDLTLARAALLRRNCCRLGLALPLFVADARRPALATDFDRVVLDLPCSGTGILARHPELKWRLSSRKISRLAARARALLAASAPLVRPGGLLIAITCSIEREENEEVVEAFLAEGDEYRLVDLEALLQPPVRQGVCGPGSWRLLPATANDGFTVHVLRRG